MKRVNLFRILIIFLASLTSIYAIRCYTGVVGEDRKADQIEECYAGFCLKVKYQSDQRPIVSYGCDQTEMCNKDGCYNGYQNSLVCCCSKDLCNSTSNHSTIFTLLPLLLIKILI
ncbi:hypothetical protein DICVIV_12623 [Dictyocaulus viviparus]|uniref:ET module n=1 Tax=Dictyocaulus viviparus TaxID=29172 RepID=A0A0D8XCA3_DICVI|nr:hypothetical protein DICVIV_12623 [Dictyocaulus viviparus]